MKISRKKLLEIIKEEVQDVALDTSIGELVLSKLLSSDKNSARKALSRLMMLDKKVQYLDQEVKRLKKQLSEKPSS